MLELTMVADVDGDWPISSVAKVMEMRDQSIRKYRSEGELPREDRMVLGRPLWHPATIVFWAIETGRMDPGTGEIRRLPAPGRPRMHPRCPTCDQPLPAGARS